MANVSANAILIRGDLREKYGLDRLETEEDLEEYYTAVSNDPDSQVTYAYDASQNNDTSKAILLQAKNDWGRMEGALAIMCPINIPMIFRRMIYSGCTGQRSIWNMRSS